MGPFPRSAVDDSSDLTWEEPATPLVTSDSTPKRKSQKGGPQMRWDVGVDQKVLLAVEYVCARDGIAINWNEIGKVVSGHTTGEAIKQHLIKVRKARIVFGQDVPPAAQRAGAKTKQTDPSKTISDQEKKALYRLIYEKPQGGKMTQNEKQLQKLKVAAPIEQSEVESEPQTKTKRKRKSEEHQTSRFSGSARSCKEERPSNFQRDNMKSPSTPIMQITGNDDIGGMTGPADQGQQNNFVGTSAGHDQEMLSEIEYPMKQEFSGWMDPFSEQRVDSMSQSLWMGRSFFDDGRSAWFDGSDNPPSALKQALDMEADGYRVEFAIEQ